MIYLSNAFSLGMLGKDEVQLTVKEVSLEEVKEIASQAVSAIGHQSTADILTALLETPIQMNRLSIKLKEDDVLFVFQLLTRLPEGKILTAEELETLPYKFYKIEIGGLKWD